MEAAEDPALHGEQEYRYMRRLCIGEKVTCVVHIIDVGERTGRSGAMTLMVLETRGMDSKQKMFSRAAAHQL